MIGEIAFAWSQVEFHLALTMGALLGVENEASVAVMTSLRNNRSKRDALTAAAEVKLENDDRIVFRAIMNLHSRFDGERNDVVHGIWGHSEEIEDAVLWHSVQTFATAHLRDYHALRPRQSNPNFDRATNMKLDMFVYSFSDLEALRNDIIQLSWIVADFHGYLRYPNEPAGASAHQQLYGRPLLAREAERLKNLGEKTPPAPT